MKCNEERELFSTECRQLAEWLTEFESMATHKDRHNAIEEQALMKIRYSAVTSICSSFAWIVSC